MRSGSECLAKGDRSVEPTQLLGGGRSRIEEAIVGLEECGLTRRIVFDSRKLPIPVSPDQTLGSSRMTYNGKGDDRPFREDVVEDAAH